jgi:predicted NUDIX family NTP pyrophosphohydrolase
MEIKKYKTQVVGTDKIGYAIDIPQLKGVLCLSEGEDEVFATYDEIGEEIGLTIRCIEDFIRILSETAEEDFEVSYEVIGTYEES